MIVTNGVVRTMDPSLPTAAALSIAGDRVAGGVGTHESALPTPERVDLRGRCVLPAFTDAHVHLFIGGAEQKVSGLGEYPDIYREFVDLIDERRSSVDVRPLRLVADCFLASSQDEVEPIIM